MNSYLKQRDKEKEEKRIQIEKQKQKEAEEKERLKKIENEKLLKKYEKIKAQENIKFKKQWGELDLKNPSYEQKIEYFKKENIKKRIIESYKGCFHEYGRDELITDTKTAKVSHSICKKCNKAYKIEVCSPWHDGDEKYIDLKFGEIEDKLKSAIFNLEEF